MYLLDTCTLIWLVSQQVSLTGKVKKILKNNAGNLYISSISALLPGIHNDPCDRIIIATAILENMIIITKDEHFSKYPDIRVVWD